MKDEADPFHPSSFRLHPLEGLRSNQEFQRVYRRGRSWAHPLLVLHVLPQPSGQRLGISVSKKVGKAVQRNLVRRRIREAVRAQAPAWKQGFDAVIVARTGAAGVEFWALSAALEELAKRARLKE
jgi:ribonuclease P protein component